MSKQAGTASSTGVVTNGFDDQKLCFEVPIYRCTEDKHDDYMAKEKARYLGPFSPLGENPPQRYAAAERRFDENVGYPWAYNEAIGWIQISIYGTEIKGELYFVKAKAIRRGMRKHFYWTDEVFAIDVFPEHSSDDIYNAICAELDKFRIERLDKKRHLDTEAFRNIGSFVEWRRLVNFYGGNGAKQSTAVIVPRADS